ncbi:MAG: trehalose-phosphatase [Mycolicibacterium hassiacum]|uniref:trehalose-phosphatase n=1 Tax=Mycolicibacterium hassiacum TaxID=46351 RepID=UPI0023F7C26E|nr:trehalose-phosphatase [Mycolicibacterium hassiacum]MBX5486058.1 trehalose-phosphatase [Mycolicibacterium hassiacum]
MLPADLQRALDAAARTSRLLVASDFDGTLAPIVNNPADARPLPAAVAALTELTELPDTEVGLVSGRALAVLRELSGVPPSVHLVGSHGAEFDSGFGSYIDRELLERIITELERIARGRAGVTVETKPASAALHVRNARPPDAEAALKAAREAAANWDVHVTEGKAVLEFAVVSTDKGEAVEILREQTRATAVVFFGDDVTDENVFRRLRRGDVGVKVGAGETAARYRVQTVDDVAEALRFLLDERRKRR